MAVTGLWLRIWIFNSPLGRIDADEAVGTLLARHMADGEFSTFLWGNSYGGTLEALIATPLIWVWDSPLVLKVVMVAMWCLACVLTWRVGLRTVGPRGAVLGAAALWVAPAPFVLASTKGRLYYGSTLVLTLVVLLLCLRLVEEPRRRDIALLGLALGLGWWSAPFFVYVALPAVLWAVVARRDLWRHLPLALPTAVVGAFPWIKYNVSTDWASFTQKPTPPTTYFGRLESFFTELIPKALSLKRSPYGWVGGGLGVAAYIVLLAGFVALVVWCCLHRRSPLIPLVVICCVYPFLFAVPDASWAVAEPRYALFLAPVLMLFAGAALGALPRPQIAGPVGVGLLALVSITFTTSLSDWGEESLFLHDIVPLETAPLIDHLDEHGITAAFGDYWLSYPVTLATRERIIIVPQYDNRYGPYAVRARRQGGARNWIEFTGSAEDGAFRADLTRLGVAYEVTPVEHYSVYRLDRTVLPDELSAG